jgi:hypothetical protein
VVNCQFASLGVDTPRCMGRLALFSPCGRDGSGTCRTSEGFGSGQRERGRVRVCLDGNEPMDVLENPHLSPLPLPKERGKKA